MLRREFLDYGFTDAEIDKILNNYSLEGVTEEVIHAHLEDNTRFFENRGLPPKTIIKLIKKEPSLIAYNDTTLKRKLNDLVDLEFTLPVVLSMVKRYPTLLTLDIDVLTDKIDLLERFGFDRAAILKMCKKFPSLLGYTYAYLFSKIEAIMDLGYTKEDVIKMGSLWPQIFSLRIKRIEDRLKLLEELKFTEEEIKKVTVDFPSIFGYKDASSREKLEYLMSIGLKWRILEEPNCLVQSVDMSKARVAFFDKNGIDVHKDNKTTLFISSLAFERKYGISKSDLMDTFAVKKAS